MARRQRPNPSLRTTAEVLSRLTETESRSRLVARESSGIDFARTIRLDHEPRRFRADRANCELKRSGAARFIEVPEMGHGGQHYLELGRRICR